jgi:hypothetical protein
MRSNTKEQPGKNKRHNAAAKLPGDGNIEASAKAKKQQPAKRGGNGHDTTLSQNAAAASFPRTLEAARELSAAEQSNWAALWKLGDALIAECGAPGPDGVRTGTDAKLQKAKKALGQHGLPYSFDHLRSLRGVAAAWPAGDRSPAVSWTCHRAAVDLETLKAAIASAQKKRVPLAVSFIRQFIADRDRESGEKERRQRPDLKGKSREEEERQQTKQKFATEVGDIKEKLKNWTKRIELNTDRFVNTDLNEMAREVESLRLVEAVTALLHVLRSREEVTLPEAA